MKNLTECICEALNESYSWNEKSFANNTIDICKSDLKVIKDFMVAANDEVLRHLFVSDVDVAEIPSRAPYKNYKCYQIDGSHLGGDHTEFLFSGIAWECGNCRGAEWNNKLSDGKKVDASHLGNFAYVAYKDVASDQMMVLMVVKRIGKVYKLYVRDI